jgi:hypothetical protein
MTEILLSLIDDGAGLFIEPDLSACITVFNNLPTHLY